MYIFINKKVISDGRNIGKALEKESRICHTEKAFKG